MITSLGVKSAVTASHWLLTKPTGNKKAAVALIYIGFFLEFDITELSHRAQSVVQSAFVTSGFIFMNNAFIDR
jgi:hypothetical protein